MADDRDVLLEKLLDRLATLDGRLTSIEHRLDVMGANWERTLRTWVRLERQGQDREQRLIALKKKRMPSIWT